MATFFSGLSGAQVRRNKCFVDLRRKSGMRVIDCRILKAFAGKWGDFGGF